MSADPKQPVLMMQDVTVTAMRDTTHAVLEQVNWSVMSGEFWVVTGRQHSGKTDFLMMAGGLMPPGDGSYRLFGRETREFGEAELPERLRLGFVFEGGHLFNELTIAENIALPLRYHRNLDLVEAGEEIRWLLELLELAPLANLTPANVSREWIKRAALARALVLQPRVLLCDNPLHGLGMRQRQWWVRFLDQLWRGHGRFGGPMTVVVTTEDLGPWQHSSRRFALLRDKQFLALGTWAELTAAANRAGRELIEEHEIKLD